jgi:GGDEF domain-containing protein
MSAQAQTPFPRRAMAQKNANSNYMDTLKRERDRFVALAFCAADVLFELDGEKKVTYAAGATKALTNLEPEEAIGSQFIDLVDRTDRGYVSERLEAMDHVNRLDPLMVRLRGPEGPTPRLMMTGYHLPDLPGSVFIALRLASKDELLTDSNDTRRDSETGLLNRDAFAEVAAQKIRDAEGRGEDLKLTMLRLGDMSDLRTRLDEEADRDLMRTLGACLTGDPRHNEAAARFDDENFGVLNSDGFDLNSLHQRIESHIRNADPQGVGIRVRHQTADASLTGASSQDTIKALLYTITQYCDDPSNEPAIKSPPQNLENLV